VPHLHCPARQTHGWPVLQHVSFPVGQSAPGAMQLASAASPLASGAPASCGAGDALHATPITADAAAAVSRSQARASIAVHLAGSHELRSGAALPADAARRPGLSALFATVAVIAMRRANESDARVGIREVKSGIHTYAGVATVANVAIAAPTVVHRTIGTGKRRTESGTAAARDVASGRGLARRVGGRVQIRRCPAAPKQDKAAHDQLHCMSSVSTPPCPGVRLSPPQSARNRPLTVSCPMML
jgi:hypothetical protein